LHANALTNPAVHGAAARVFSRAFETLLHRPTAEALHTLGISRTDLMPSELAESRIDKIRNAYAWQWQRLKSD